MQEQGTEGHRVSTPLVVQECEVHTGHPHRHYVVRREPDPEIAGAWITEVIRDDVRPGPGYGDIHTRRAVDWIEDDGQPLDELARQWAARHGLGERAA